MLTSAIYRPDLPLGLREQLLRRAGVREIGRPQPILPPFRGALPRSAPISAGHDDDRTLFGEEACGCEPDSPCGARHHTHALAEAEVQSGYVNRRDHAPPRTPRRDRLERPETLAGPLRPAAERARAAQQARLWRRDSTSDRRRLLERPRSSAGDRRDPRRASGLEVRLASGSRASTSVRGLGMTRRRRSSVAPRRSTSAGGRGSAPERTTRSVRSRCGPGRRRVDDRRPSHPTGRCSSSPTAAPIRVVHALAAGLDYVHDHRSMRRPWPTARSSRYADSGRMTRPDYTDRRWRTTRTSTRASRSSSRSSAASTRRAC